MVSMTNECHNIGTIMEITLASLLVRSHHPYPNIPPRNEPEDLTFLSASAISWMASFSFPELYMLVILPQFAFKIMGYVFADEADGKLCDVTMHSSASNGC